MITNNKKIKEMIIMIASLGWDTFKLFCELLSEVYLWPVGCTKEEGDVVYALYSSKNLK